MNFDPIASFQNRTQFGFDAIDFSARCTVTDMGTDSIGKVKRCGAARQLIGITVWGIANNFTFVKIVNQFIDHRHRIGWLLFDIALIVGNQVLQIA